MALPPKEQVTQLVDFFTTLGQRQQLSESLEAQIEAHEQQLEGQRQEVENLRTEKQALLIMIRELMTQLEDLTSELPQKAQALELRLSETRQAVAAGHEELRRLQAHQQSVQEQIRDGDTRVTFKNIWVHGHFW